LPISSIHCDVSSVREVLLMISVLLPTSPR